MHQDELLPASLFPFLSAPRRAAAVSRLLAAVSALACGQCCALCDRALSPLFGDLSISPLLLLLLLLRRRRR
jgi:hypothetical protein